MAVSEHELMAVRAQLAGGNISPLTSPSAALRGRIAKSFNQLGKDYYGATFSGDEIVASIARNISKAVGTSSLGGNFGNGQPLLLQNLDSVMTSVLWQNQNFVLFNWLERVPTIQPLFQWDRRQAYGSIRGSAMFSEGGVPSGGISAWQRNQMYVAYAGVRRGITHVMALTGQLGGSLVDPVAEENRNGAMQLLAMLETNVLFGDSALPSNTGSTVNYDGIYNQILKSGVANTNVIDLKGGSIDFSNFEDIGRKMATQGYVFDFSRVRAFMSPSVLEDLAKIKMVEERKILAAENPDGGFRSGVPLAGHQTNFGFIPFTWSVFMDEVQNGRPQAVGDALAPAQPSATVSAGAPGSGETSYFLNTNGAGVSDAGTYTYWVAAVNDGGESAAVQAATSVNVAAGQVVTVTITPGASNGQPVNFFRVYRGGPGVTDINDESVGIIGHVPAAASGNTTFVDNNSKRPQSGYVFVLEGHPDNLALVQMTPLIKWPLAITNTTVEWLLLLYHVPVVKAPERMFVIKNIGKLNL